MTYRKFIHSGENFELYEYEREPRYMAPRHRNRQRKGVNSDSGPRTGGENTDEALQDKTTGKRQDNAKRAALVFRRLVASNLSRSQPPLLITFTYEQNITDLSVGYRDYRTFVQALRYTYGKAFKYVAVPEFQKRGAVHFHALFWGLPEEVFLQERQTRKIAGLWGVGFVFIKRTDGDGRLSSYLSKYMAKAFTDSRLRNQKAYVASKNIKRPIEGKGIPVLWPIYDDYVGENNIPIIDKTYGTKWLGTCRYRLFKIAPATE